VAHPNVDKLTAVLESANLLSQLAALSNYDARTGRPVGGEKDSERRSAFATKLAHEAFTSSAVSDALGRCETATKELSPFEALLVKRLRLCLNRALALPADFVERRNQAHAKATNVWTRARAEGNFTLFAPELTHVLTLAKEEAALLGADPGEPDSISNALLGQFEPGATTAEVLQVLDDLGEWLGKTIQTITGAGANRSDAVLRGCFPTDKQRQLAEYLATVIGYDFKRGSLAIAAHPFASTICAGDHRIATRFYPNYLAAGIFGTAHEAGHAMLEQGAPDLFWGFDNSSMFLSMALHESQSRLWENMVCRSWSFWKYFYPHLQLMFREFQNVPLEEFYRAINLVRPSGIRVEADELTYHGHILVRFKIEQLLLSDQISVADIPDVFANLVEKYVDYRPTDPKEGALQDIHWGSGYFGYFGTYTLGTLASAQEFAAFTKIDPEYEADFATGKFANLRTWLSGNIYPTGHVDSLNSVLTKATGEPLTARYWKEYITKKFGTLYGVSL